MFCIASYDKYYQPLDKSGRVLKHADYVKLPVRPKGDGLQALLEHKRGLEVFGIWCLLLEKATAQKPENRGKLLNYKDEPATVEEIAKGISLGKSVKLVKYAISLLVSMGWIKGDIMSPKSGTSCAPKSRGEERREEERRGIKEKEPTDNKILFLEYVLLTEQEHSKLIERFGEYKTKQHIADLNNYIGSKGVKYKSHYYTILSWERKNDRNNRQTVTSGAGQSGPRPAKPRTDRSFTAPPEEGSYRA